GSNVLDGAAPWYGAYATADGRHMAVGAVEDRFWAQLLQGLGLDAASLPAREDRAHWPGLRAVIAGAMATKTQNEWELVFAGTDACVSPVLTLSEAPHNAHLQARGAFVDAGRMLQPAPAPRFSATPGRANLETPFNAAVDAAYLAEWGLAAAQADGVLAVRTRETP
ncbi:MAG: CoA transferase, partial [Rubrivivax sp.]